MEKCGELPAAEPEIEPRCPGLVLKLPGLSRRAMSRLQCRGIFLPVKSKAPMGRVNPPPPHRRVAKHWNSVCLSVSTTPRWCREEAERSGGSLPALLSVSASRGARLCRLLVWSGQVSAARLGSRVPFPPRCAYCTGQLACGSAWRWEAAGSRV